MANNNPQRPLTNGLSGSRPPHSATTARRGPSLISPSAAGLPRGDPFDSEVLAEEGASRHMNGNASVAGDDTMAGDVPIKKARTNSFSREGRNEWEVLLQTVQEVWRAWKRKWDKEGVAGLTARVPHLHQALSSARLNSASSLRAYLSTAISIIPPRRRALIAITATLIFFFLLLAPSSRSRRGANPFHAGLARSGIDAAIIDRTTGVHRGHNKAKILESFSNPYGFINLVDPYAGGVFNPSILVLPDTVGVGWRHLLVARGAERFEVIDGEDTRWETVVGCFLLPLKRPYLELPYLARESELEVLKLPAKRKTDFMRCHEHVYDQFIGPEDPRLFFTHDGQPLLVYSQTGRAPNICRAIYIIDARMVIPGLDKALKRGGWSPPMVFKEQTDLIREDQFNIEKNWAIFEPRNGELYFHVSVVPQQIYKYVPGLTLRALNPAPPTHNCVSDVVGAEMNRVKFHHATPFLRVTLCRRGECVPDIHNTVLVGIIHIKYHPLPYLFYERRAVTLNVTSPFEYVSVSKPLTYSGTNQGDPIFSCSLSWDHPTTRKGLGLNHGFLDDILILSFGVFDYGSAYIDVLARDLLTEHTICDDMAGAPSTW